MAESSSEPLTFLKRTKNNMENQLISLAKDRGLKLQKSAQTDPDKADYNTYYVLDKAGKVIFPNDHEELGFGAEISEVEVYLNLTEIKELPAAHARWKELLKVSEPEDESKILEQRVYQIQEKANEINNLPRDISNMKYKEYYKELKKIVVRAEYLNQYLEDKLDLSKMLHNIFSGESEN